LEEFAHRLQPRLLAAVEANEHAHTPRLREALGYTLLAPGKRIRAAVIDLWARSAGGASEDLVLDAATAAELIHSASLILDDLPSMDDARTRRGLPCCHLVFGVDTAILVATANLARAFEILGEVDARSRRSRLTSLFAKAVGVQGMIGGQHVDLHLKPQIRDLDTLEYIHRHKTGELFGACARAGVLLSKGDERLEEIAANYARNLGLAFQIKDDLLDALGHSEEMGKDARKDRGKATFVSSLGAEASEEIMNRLLATAKESLFHLESADPLLLELCSFVGSRRN
jgi:geranylgeranyl diphosphate synthase type II